MPKILWEDKGEFKIVISGRLPGSNIIVICRNHRKSFFYNWRDAFMRGGMLALQNGRSERKRISENKLCGTRDKAGKQDLQINLLFHLQTDKEINHKSVQITMS